MNLPRTQGRVPYKPSEHYTSNFISINKSRANPDNWAVAFEIRTKTGSLLEGSVFVMVDDSTSEAWFFWLIKLLMTLLILP